jgi:hypothetical protein
MEISMARPPERVDLNVQSPQLDVNSLKFQDSIRGGNTVQAKMHLNAPAMPLSCGPYDVMSSNTQLANVPATVTVPPNQTDATFSITTSAVLSVQTVSITLSFGWGVGLTKVQKTLTITP